MPRYSFSAALCRGLIEAPPHPHDAGHIVLVFSAALCRGLIEAAQTPIQTDQGFRRFPRLYAAASLKLGSRTGVIQDDLDVFRGFMPRPH